MLVEGRHLEDLTADAVLTRGFGRSYGDASLPPAGRGPVASSLRAERVLAFDEDSGLLRAEAGLSVGRLAEMFLPRGWFLPVTPGTRFVSMGGLVAADVHGKNHHVAGTVGAHVEAFRMRLPDGRIEDVTDESSPEVFRATLGGMGLTGHVLDVTLRMQRVPSPFLVQQTTAHPDLESLVDGLVDAGRTWPLTVAWSDWLATGGRTGRGVLLCGRWAETDDGTRDRSPELPPLSVPLPMPGFLLTNASVAAFNLLKYERARRDGGRRRQVVRAGRFFYPLDVVGDWNRLYGRRGLTQYQCVLPHDPSMRSVRRLLEAARSGGPGPFLVVIKDCGDEGKGLLSFPRPGLSFALDYPVHDGTAALVARLNSVVIEAGGRIYLAKDAFTTAADFAAMEPRLPAFLETRRRLDPDGRLDSALARRLFPAD